jgi:hypothetical protein
MPTRAMRSIAAVGVAAAVSICSLFVACESTTATSPPLRSTLILGDFGGVDSQLHADSMIATLDYHCSTVVIRPALVSDSSGTLATAGQRRRNGGAPLPGEGSTPVRITGRASVADGGSLQLIISPIPEEPGAPTGPADTLTLVRGRTATLFLCP